MDRELFAKLKEEVPEPWARESLKDQCWGQPISAATLDKLYSIDRFLERLDSEFLDPTCEGYRAEFFQAYRAFWNDGDFTQISPLDHRPDMYRLPKEWMESDDPKIRNQFFACMNNLNLLSNKAFNAYEQMIREIRRLLIIR